MALHHNASNIHLSLTHRTTPLLSCAETFDWASSWVYWPCNNSCQMCAHCQHCVKTTQTHMLMLVTFKPQKTVVKGCKKVRYEAGTGCLVCTSVLCCKHSPKGSPVEMALLWVRGDGGGGVALKRHWFLELRASKWGWLYSSGEFTQSLVPSLPHGFTSLLVFASIRQVHVSAQAHRRAWKSPRRH